MSYYRFLNIPVLFVPPKLSIGDEKVHEEQKIVIELINDELHQWLESINLKIYNGRYFYAPPYCQYNLHIDSSWPLNNQYTKLNWITGGKNSRMEWFKLYPEKTSKWYINLQGEVVRRFDLKDVKKVESIELHGSVLVNAGEIHRIVNDHEARHCYSFFLKDLESDKIIEWDEAISRFKDFYT